MDMISFLNEDVYCFCHYISGPLIRDSQSTHLFVTFVKNCIG